MSYYICFGVYMGTELASLSDYARKSANFRFVRKYICCCRRQHTILNMKYCVYVCPVSLAELCIAKRELDFFHVRMYGCTDDQIYDVF